MLNKCLLILLNQAQRLVLACKKTSSKDKPYIFHFL